MTPNEYWAKAEAKELITELDAREKKYFEYCNRRGYSSMWLTMMESYYGIAPGVLAGFGDQTMSADGQDGEMLRFRINFMRSFGRQLIGMVTKDRPLFKAVATNTDSQSRRQTESAESGITYVYEDTYGELKEFATMERGELFAKAYIWVHWDPDGGEDVAEIPDQKTGAIVTDVLCPWEYFCDPTVSGGRKHTWQAARERRSKWEAAAAITSEHMIAERLASMLEHEQMKREEEGGEPLTPDEVQMMGVEAAEEAERDAERLRAGGVEKELAFQLMYGFDDQTISEDDIIVKHFYHLPSAAYPEGRYLIYAGDVVISDRPFPEGLTEIPIVEYQEAELIGTAMGYSDFWDLVVVQQMITEVTSDMATAVSTYGHPTMYMDKGTEIDIDDLAQGNVTLVKPPNAQPPAFVQPPTINEGGKWLLSDFLMPSMRDLSGLNEVMRGNADAKVTSGTMAALFHNIGYERSSPRQGSLDLLRERVANLMLALLKHNAKHPYIIEIVGQDEKYNLQTFTAETLTGVKRVRLKTDSPMLRTMAGRRDLADFVMQIPGAVKTPQEAIELVTSGKITQMYRAGRAEITRVQHENEVLLRGTQVQQAPGDPDPLTGLPGPPVTITPEIPVLITDNPFVHVPEHLSGLESPEALQDPNYRAALMAHIQWHMREYRKLMAMPDLAAVLKIPLGPGVMGPATPGEMPAPTAAMGVDKEQIGGQSVPLPKPAEPPPNAKEAM